MSEVLGLNGDPLQRAFEAMIGLPAWLVRKGFGSSLTMEFGNPHLYIRDPMVASPHASDRVRRKMARRLVVPQGEWHLWIYCCHWRVISDDEEIASSESSEQAIVDAAREIDGQLLTKVEADPANGTSGFVFDHGAALQTWPWAEGNREQWMLYMSSGNVFTYRADGRYSLGSGSKPLAAEDWQGL